MTSFVGWCDGQGFNPFHAAVVQVLDFLQEKSKLVQLNTVLGYVTDITECQQDRGEMGFRPEAH